ncbi:MAG: uridine kinase [Micrococcales bacterium]|nr:uridine kinase [Micrococcales bacterium]
MPDPVAVAADAVRAGPARLGSVRLVCVDGPAGSGKTTFAQRLATCLDADEATAGRTAVLHLDDLYEGWSGLEGSLWPRLSAQVLEPLRRGEPGRYQRYDWESQRFDGWVDVPVPSVLVIEGCGSGRRAGAGLTTALVWVEASAELRLRRGLARDGERARQHWLTWMDDEARHFAAEGTAARADVRVDAWGRMPS